LIAGFGSGGLAAALAHPATCLEVEVCEQTRELKEIGAGLKQRFS
jgi:hypothetical protein